MSVIEVKSLTKDYGSGRGVFDVSLAVEKGEVFGFLGPNGAGKSTTIRHLMGFSKPDSGETLIFGKSTFERYNEILNRVGYIPGEIALPQGLTGMEFIRMMQSLQGTTNEEKLKEMLDMFELTDVMLSGETKRMSLGVKRKLAVVTAFMSDPEVLILDEPTSGLDVLARDELMDILHAYIEDGEHSVLFSTHITADLERAADFITYITDGRLYYTGPKDEFEESFRLVKGGPDELAQLPADVVLGSHTYATGFDALVRSDRLDAVASVVSGLVVESASIDDIIRLTNAHDSNRDLSGR